MNFIFGPVNSRRLGRSLGIDLFPRKICNLNCVYCEVGPTITPVCKRGVYSSVAAIMAEVDDWCGRPELLANVDVVTVTAKGEPTLHSELGVILRHLKEKCRKPVAVLTNGTTLMDEAVRQDLMIADIVVPSLDAARPASFDQVDRPAAGVDLKAVIDGLILFSLAFMGKIWLEILLVQGMNDAADDIEALITALRPMRLDRIQLNTVVRPPVEATAKPLSPEQLAVVAARFGAELGLPVDVPFAVPDELALHPHDNETTTPPATLAAVLEEIQKIVRRRPCTAVDINRIFHLGGPEKVEQLLAPLVHSGVLHTQEHGGNRYYHRAD
jgi:wyosine [tRNA(Phe)-imidazoG37] synthetase (radical SAM superfamily)